MVQINVNFTNNPQGVYYSGQILSGEIEIDNEKTRSIRCITMEIEGFAKCKWNQHEGTGKTRRTVHYRGNESYLKTFTFLMGSHQNDPIELPVGKHNFNFSCHLPHTLPTSFESAFGQIRYQLKIKVDRPWKFDIKSSFGFTVIRVTDLNFIQPSLLYPVKSECSKSFFMGLSSKELFMSAEIPLSGFVSGQPVPISIKINNNSKVDVENVKVSLKQIIHCHAQSPRRATKEQIMSFSPSRYEGIKAKQKGNVEASLVIPSVSPTNIGTCGVVEVFYEIHVLAKVGGIHRSPVIRLPVTIGTIPLYNSFNIASMPHANSNVLQPNTSTYPDISSATAPNLSPENLPPPSYEVAIGLIPEKNEEESSSEGLNSEESPFNPRYPVYDFTNSQGAFVAPPLPVLYGFNSEKN